MLRCHGYMLCVVRQTWRELDACITDVTNEAKDNLKYLSTLEQLCKPLYDGNLHTMLDSIPALISNIQMVYVVSRYYNTSERMTSLYVKVKTERVDGGRYC